MGVVWVLKYERDRIKAFKKYFMQLCFSWTVHSKFPLLMQIITDTFLLAHPYSIRCFDALFLVFFEGETTSIYLIKQSAKYSAFNEKPICVAILASRGVVYSYWGRIPFCSFWQSCPLGSWKWTAALHWTEFTDRVDFVTTYHPPFERTFAAVTCPY